MTNEDIFGELIAQSTGDKVESIIPLPQAGSDRNYYRINCRKATYIGTVSNNIEENSAFLYLANHFEQKGLNTPRVIATSSDLSHYIQSDLGDLSLYKIIQDKLKTSRTDDEVTDYLKQCLSHLVDFQFKGHDGLDYSKAYPSEAFDKASIMADLNYFKYYFLKMHESVIFNEKRLEDDFNRLADFMVQAPSGYFMYRDFQSRNIMIKDGQTYFIDFQGGRRGPLQYDVVSLLYQVKSRLSQETKTRLIDYYKTELSKYMNPAELEFDRFMPAFVVVRLLQVLGAYGFRGLIQKKSHFIESISLALESLKNEYRKLELHLPELNSAIEQSIKLSYIYSVSNCSTLKVTVYSFSYKNGSYPPDYSGNGGGHVFDCRSLPNPGREAQFKMMNGTDSQVADYLLRHESVKQFIANTRAIISQSVDNYIERGFNSLSVSFGCTGGQHRSVFFAQQTFEWLKNEYPNIKLEVKHLVQHITQTREA